VTSVLGFLVTLGYALIIFTNSVTEVPLVIQQVDDEIKSMKSKSAVRKSWWEIWGSSVYALVCACGFISFHVINFHPAITLYIFVFFILNFPLALRAFRKYASENPGTKFRRNYAIVYDLLIVRTFLRNHLVLTLFCFMVKHILSFALSPPIHHRRNSIFILQISCLTIFVLLVLILSPFLSLSDVKLLTYKKKIFAPPGIFLKCRVLHFRVVRRGSDQPDYI
jgi:hypothetical protein